MYLLVSQYLAIVSSSLSARARQKCYFGNLPSVAPRLLVHAVISDQRAGILEDATLNGPVQ